MKRLVIALVVISVLSTFWVASVVVDDRAAYVKAQRGPR